MWSENLKCSETGMFLEAKKLLQRYKEMFLSLCINFILDRVCHSPFVLSRNCFPVHKLYNKYEALTAIFLHVAMVTGNG